VKKFLSKNKLTNFFVFNLILVFFLLVLSFPLYNLILSISGYEKESLSDNNYVKNSIVLNPENKTNVVLERVMDVNLISEVDSDLKWTFMTEEENIQINVGENKIVKFEGTNISGKTITATADFVADPENISPYLIKTECFCFIEQTLEPGESKTFTMVFFIDSSIDDNSLFDDLNQITLTYKFSEFAS